MNPTDFAKYLTKFLSEFLLTQKNASKNTIISYRDTFKILLNYCQDTLNIPVEKLNMNMIDQKLIVNFLDWLEVERKSSISTRNQRLAAIHSFFRYVQYEEPSDILHFQKVISIPIKKAPKPTVPYLTSDAMELLLAQPDKTTKKGRRDLALLSTLYDSGCRVQELITLKIRDVILYNPAVLILTGKGNKTRRVPLMKATQNILKHYISENALDKSWKTDYTLFMNNQNKQLTKEGISYIISKYVNFTRTKSKIIPDKVTPHMFRHSKAVHLLNSGVNLVYIRDFLGHEDIKTTEIYAKCDNELKRTAIENAYPSLVDDNLPDWNNDSALIDWLSKL